MTLLLMEGFDHYANYLLKGWQSLQQGGNFPIDSTGVVTPGRIGVGQCMKIGIQADSDFGSGTNRSIYKMFAPATEAIFGFALLTPGSGNVTEPAYTMVNFVDAGRNAIVSMKLTATQLPDFGVVVSAIPHTHGVWTYYEVRIKLAGAASVIEVKRNGGDDIAPTTVNLGAGPLAGIEFHTYSHQQNVSRYYHVDDVYVVDKLGAAPRNDFLGDVRVETLYPTQAGAKTEWSPVGGPANWAQVDEVPPDSDTTYVTSNTPGAKDTYICSDLTAAGIVYGVQTNLFARKTTAGFKQIRAVVREGATDYPGGTKTMAASYNIYSEILQQDPAGGDWNTVKVNAAEFGVEVVT